MAISDTDVLKFLRSVALLADKQNGILRQNADGTPAIWLMDGLNLVSGTNVGLFNPGPRWHVIDQRHDLLM